MRVSCASSINYFAFTHTKVQVIFANNCTAISEELLEEGGDNACLQSCSLLMLSAAKRLVGAFRINPSFTNLTNTRTNQSSGLVTLAVYWNMEQVVDYYYFTVVIPHLYQSIVDSTHAVTHLSVV